MRFALLALAASSLALHSTAAQGPTDEIQVYDAEIADVGKFNLMVHGNFTPSGIGTPSFAGAIVARHSLNGVFEWAYGATPWLELGLYLPLYSVTDQYGATLNGGKLRVLFVAPNAADRPFFYGVNFEFSDNSTRWDTRRYTSEIRPILGWHSHPWDFIVNPILDNSWEGGIPALEFNPAARVAYHVDSTWALAAEHYAGLGPLHGLLPGNQQVQQTWAVFDRYATINIEGGIGFGLTPASDRITLKLMFSRDLP